MKPVSIITRSLNIPTADATFASLRPDIDEVVEIRPNAHVRLIPRNPLDAGVAFHRLLLRMGDSKPLSFEEKALLPWLSALRNTIWNLGASEMEIEAALPAFNGVPHGVCDLLVTGGPGRRGVVEVKVVAHGAPLTPRSRDLAQVGAYAQLAARHARFSDTWAAVAYIELAERRMHLIGFRNARQLIFKTADLLAA